MKNRIEFYHSLALLLEAGLPLIRALSRNFQGSFRRAGHKLARYIQDGMNLHEAMRQLRCFNTFECNLVRAGESSGHLPDTLRALSQWFEQQQRLRSKLVSGLLYPLFLYFVACILLAVIACFSGGKNNAAILTRLVSQLLIPPAMYLLIKLFKKFLLPLAPIGQFIDFLPLLGKLQHNLETARFCKAMGMALSSGLSMQSCITLAANCCHNAAYRSRFLKLNRILHGGKHNFAQAFYHISNHHDHNSSIGEMLETGEQSGQLEVYCDRIAKLLNADAELAFDRIGTMLPFCIYLLMISFIAMQILKLAGSYSGMLQGLMESPF
ncbi:MAG: hypothetical protein GX946_11010 [Oligosphaeraceae bacterium]|nr:hypothetical protein [Oligosphaeraceae bacterium]